MRYIGEFPEVTHSYLRDNALNIRFARIAVDEKRIEEILEQIRVSLSLDKSQIPNLPVERLLLLDSRFSVSWRT